MATSLSPRLSFRPQMDNLGNGGFSAECRPRKWRLKGSLNLRLAPVREAGSKNDTLVDDPFVTPAVSH
jgi:hypothetical protein